MGLLVCTQKQKQPSSAMGSNELEATKNKTNVKAINSTLISMQKIYKTEKKNLTSKQQLDSKSLM